jgi:protein-S-isoprenylcysteine O-methyltransferase Ste14
VWLFVKNILFTVLVPAAAGLYVPWWIAGGPIPSPTLAPRSLAGVLLLMAGAAGYLWCQWEFVTFGRGTPAPIDPPKHLVIRGPYRVLRNPMYVSVLLVVLGWSVYLRSSPLLLYAGALWVMVHIFVVAIEEPSLRRRFGDPYVQYCRSVQRWRPTTPRS